MSSIRIDPIRASDDIRETYLRYLTTTFGLKESDLAKQFRKKARESTGLFRGPILEATSKYKKGKSILEILSSPNSYLSSEFLNFAPGLSKSIVQECFPLDRELYLHQEKCLRKVIGENRNVVIATGTGSGKTECFLFPIVDYLLRERTSGSLGPGVRALLIYPMNALANDQIYRLRQMLPPETGITFGRYTGQTEQAYYQGLDAFKQENASQIPQSNESICREQILGVAPTGKDWPHKKYDPFIGPPHILLTNYAMLEYLLMRPRDTALFDGGAGDTWRFLVLDEAHVYSGALGTEIGYLIRRLKDRICLSQKGKLLCIATSATIGADGIDSEKLIARSFENLFGETFDERDVITGDVVPSETLLSEIPEWGIGSSEFYRTLENIVEKEVSSVPAFVERAKKELSPKALINEQNGWPDRTTLARAIAAAETLNDIKRAIEVFLFHIMGGDKRLKFLIKKLEKHPIDLKKDAYAVWSMGEAANNKDFEDHNLISLVDLASHARFDLNGATLLAARYHFFVRSLEGMSICFVKGGKTDAEEPKLLIGRHQIVPDAPGGPAIGFELRACTRCGQPFLHGYFGDDGRFLSYPQRLRMEDKMKPGAHLAINLNEVIESSEDEDPLREENPPVSGEDEGQDSAERTLKTSATLMDRPRYLCARCGFVNEDNISKCTFCYESMSRISCDWVEVRRVYPNMGGIVKVCPACGGHKYFGGSIIRAFSPGDDAAGAVLAHSLMTSIPPTMERDTPEVIEDIQAPGRFTKGLSKNVKDVLKGKRRLLAFSDSRQDAAYFSSYLNRTSNQILHRQLILGAMRRLMRDNLGLLKYGCNDLINPLILEAQEVGLFNSRSTDIEKKTEVSKWLTAELACIQRRYGLEGVGLITWELKYRNALLEIAEQHENELIKDYHVTGLEFVLLLELFLSELRKQNVLQPIYNTSIQDPYFWPRNRPYTIRLNNVNSALSIASWLPQSSKNIRSEFLERLLSRMGFNVDNQTIRKVLSDLWDLSTCDVQQIPIWEEVASVNMLWGGRGNDGAVRRLRWDAWQGCVKTDEVTDVIYKCDACGNLSHINLKNVCPTYKCPGNLYGINPKREFGDNHYRYLYERTPIPIIASEHTAQISNQAGAKRQREFCSDSSHLNILSCSTTFELGVDVGQLHAVFLRNVPPTIANYVQRSGRAGRRLSAAAFVLTFCRSRPHDLGYFDVIDRLITGRVSPPRVIINNLRVARRHLHSLVLSRFWRTYHPELFDGPENKRRGIVQWFFFEPAETGAKMVYDWLQNKPEDLYAEIKRVLPTGIAKGLGIETWRWANELVRKPTEIGEDVWWDGQLGLTQSELRNEYREYEKLQIQKPNLYNLAEAHKRRIRERQILDLLASRNVLPKYGFPIDVVSLKIQSTDEWAQEIELDRDMRVALSEYAPGCTLVANGRIVKSYALDKIPGKAWPEYRFAICGHCGRFYRSEISEGDLRVNCQCGQSLENDDSTILQGVFVEPRYGFRTQLNEDGQVPVEVKPQRTFSTRVYFSHYNWAKEEPFLTEGVPDKITGMEIHKRYSRYGVLAVINPGRSERGFWLCPFCGYGDAVAGGMPKIHRTPWGNLCKGKLRQVYLGHEFQSDVLEIRFVGSAFNKADQGYWLSMTAALLAGASKALDIERDDIDGTVLQFAGEGYKSIVLFDDVPGGAGHVDGICGNLKKVIEAAYTIADNCSGCSRDQSCNACLRNFRNQYVHDLLKRGPVADSLSKILSSLYRANENGYFPLGLTDSGRWLEQLFRRSDRADIILDLIPIFPAGEEGGKEWYSIIHDMIRKGTRIRLFLTIELEGLLRLGPQGKVTLHSLAALSQSPEIDIFTVTGQNHFDLSAFLEVNGEAYAIRWPPNKNPFEAETSIELSVLRTYVSKVKEMLRALAEGNAVKRWDLKQFDKLLQGIEVILIKEGLNQSWKDFLLPHLPVAIKKVEIYDRFIRNLYQFKSLEMLLDAFIQKASREGIEVKITTTAENFSDIQNEFIRIQDKYVNRGVQIEYEVLEPNKSLPHFRKTLIQSEKGNYSIWLDRGIDIFRFADLKRPKFVTLESYIVIERE